MSMQPIKSAVLAGTFVALASLVVTACGEKSSDQSGAGGAMGAGGAGTGAGGAGVAGVGGAAATGGMPFTPPTTDSGACRNTDAPCERTTDCCAGNVCSNNFPNAAMNGCKIACTQNSECPSGCCYMFIGGMNGGICSDAQWCACGGTGAACSSTLPGCCNTHQCQGGMCNQKCTSAAECASQCCLDVPLLPNTKTCVDRMYCPAP